MPSVKNPREGTHRELIELLMIMGQKMNSVHLLQKGKKRAVGRRKCRIKNGLGIVIFRERGSDFSLRSRQIGPSDFFGPRSKVVLRIEDNTWASVSRFFDKLREVEVLSYLV